jgi:hypothetical protein
MKERLEWILAQLVKLDANGQIRYEGNSLYQAAKQELESIIAGWVDVVPPPPAIVQQVMSEEQVDALVARFPTGEQLLAGVIAEQEKSELAILGAVAETRAELLAAVAPAAA